MTTPKTPKTPKAANRAVLESNSGPLVEGPQPMPVEPVDSVLVRTRVPFGEHPPGRTLKLPREEAEAQPGNFEILPEE